MELRLCHVVRCGGAANGPVTCDAVSRKESASNSLIPMYKLTRNLYAFIRAGVYP